VTWLEVERPPRVMLITAPAFADELTVKRVAEIAASLPLRGLVVQLRDKRRVRTSLRVFAWQLRTVTRAYGARLVVNGHVDIAREVGADGVHLGQGSGSVAAARLVLGRASWISVAAHTDHDVSLAREQGADAVLVSPVFVTQSGAVDGRRKTPRGLSCIRSARQCAGRELLVYALGGVSAATARACASSGADGIALTSGLLGAHDPGREARAIHDVWARR
jgi:thiamine-phosphate pyrophosphorylase